MTIRRLGSTWLKGIALLFILALAVCWRDSKYVIGSSSRIGSLFLGTHRPWSLLDLAIDFFILFLVARLVRALAARVIFAWHHRNSMPANGESKGVVVSDAPVSTIEGDGLSRASFVATIVDLVTSANDAGSTVIGIEGRWGEGKTSVLHLVALALGKVKPKPLVILFDPWPEDSKRGVVARLLDTIADGIARNTDIAPALRRGVSGFVRSLADAVGHDFGATYSLAIRSVFRWLDPGTTSYLRDPLSSLPADRDLMAAKLAQLPCQVVIIVDDLDRVDADELRGILMAINALSSFPKTSFLLAFDPQVVDAHFSRLGFTTTDIPFREKIVHISQPLPPAAYADRLRLLQSSLEGVLTARDIKSDWDFWDAALRSEAETLAVRNVLSPRGLKRLANQAGVVLARVRREVNAADVLLLELLRVQFPSAWEFVRSRRNELDPYEYYVEGSIPSDRDQRVDVPKSDSREPNSRSRALRDLAISSLSEDAKPRARQVLQVLFPNQISGARAQQQREEWQRSGRVAWGQHLRNYFSLGVAGAEFPSEDIRTFLSDPKARQPLLDDAVKRGLAGSFLSFVAVHAEGIREIPELEQLIDVVLHFTRVAWLEGRANVTEEALQVLVRTILRAPQDDRKRLLTRIVDSTESVSASHEVVLHLLQEAQLWSNGVFYPEGVPGLSAQLRLVSTRDLIELKDRWTEAVWKYGIDRVLQEEPIPLSILYRLGQLEGQTGNDYSRVSTSLWASLALDENLRAVVRQYSSQFTGRPTGVQGLEKLISNWPEFIARVRKLGEPQDAIEKLSEYLPGSSSE